MGTLFTWLNDLIYENSKKLVWAGLLSLAALVFWSTLTTAQLTIDGYIRDVIIGDLKDDKSQTWKTLSETLGRLRKSEVGSLTAGTFLLTPTARSYTHYVYLPADYKGKLTYHISGILRPNCRYVTISLPDGKPRKLKDAEGTIVLEKYFKRSSEQAADQDDDSIEPVGLRRNLRAITFQLGGDSTDAMTTPQSTTECAGFRGPLSATDVIESTYATFVTPAVRISD